MDLGGFEAVTVYTKNCAECGKEIRVEVKAVKLCGLCQTVGQVLYLHYVKQYQRWQVLPTSGRFSEAV